MRVEKKCKLGIPFNAAKLGSFFKRAYRAPGTNFSWLLSVLNIAHFTTTNTTSEMGLHGSAADETTSTAVVNNGSGEPPLQCSDPGQCFLYKYTIQTAAEAAIPTSSHPSFPDGVGYATKRLSEEGEDLSRWTGHPSDKVCLAQALDAEEEGRCGNAVHQPPHIGCGFALERGRRTARGHACGGGASRHVGGVQGALFSEQGG